MSHKIKCTDISFAYHQRQVIAELSVAFKSGEFVGLIGPNGAGKSTLLKLLLGLIEANTGEVLLDDKPLLSLPRKEIAHKISLVPQDHAIEYAFSVQEIVAMGRTPYLGNFQAESEKDIDIINQALERTDLTHLAKQRADQLSGGERQRVFIARALAQQTDSLLLDEPTANLDLCHQLELMSLLKSLTRENKLAIAAIHDLELASRFCDRLVLLAEGKIVADGTPTQVLNAENLARYFSIEATVSVCTETTGLRISAHSSIQNTN